MLYEVITKAVIDLLSKGGDDRAFRVKYDNILDKEKFIVAAAEDGFEFTVAELDAVIRITSYNVCYTKLLR